LGDGGEVEVGHLLAEQALVEGPLGQRNVEEGLLGLVGLVGADESCQREAGGGSEEVTALHGRACPCERVGMGMKMSIDEKRRRAGGGGGGIEGKVREDCEVGRPRKSSTEEGAAMREGLLLLALAFNTPSADATHRTENFEITAPTEKVARQVGEAAERHR